MVDKETQCKPPTEQMAACRALCLGVVIMRGEFEQVIQAIHEPAVVGMNKGLIADSQAWARREGLASHLTDREKAFLGKPAGAWGPQELAGVKGCAESLGVILWALSLITTLPPPDTPFAQPDVIRRLRLLKPTKDFFQQVKLRAQEEISDSFEVYERLLNDGKEAPLVGERHSALGWLTGHSGNWDWGQ
ncbi:MAG: DUF4272 domain-containing protein [Armatimonadetes bacterium]|nr:DUF4272 domain-containing protein [Armatimonadota bacterium]